MDFVELCTKVLDKFGMDAQLNQMAEECAEYIVALNHYRRGRITQTEFFKEIADVSVMCDEMALYFPLEHFKQEKIERLITKIEEGE